MKSYFLQRFFEIGVIIIGLICLGAYLSSTLPPDTLVVKNDVSFQSNETVEITLSGEVKSPGTYTVLEGTMLYDVIRKAGGVTDKADLSSFDCLRS